MIINPSIKLMHKYYLFQVFFHKIFKKIMINNFKHKKMNLGLKLKFLLTKKEITTSGLWIILNQNFLTKIKFGIAILDFLRLKFIMEQLLVIDVNKESLEIYSLRLSVNQPIFQRLCLKILKDKYGLNNRIMIF